MILVVMMIWVVRLFMEDFFVSLVMMFWVRLFGGKMTELAVEGHLSYAPATFFSIIVTVISVIVIIIVVLLLNHRHCRL